MVGGEIREHTELLEDTRRQAFDRMVHDPTRMGAHAVLSMWFDSSSWVSGRDAAGGTDRSPVVALTACSRPPLA
ncbi:MAG: heavy metal-binding domain-containing protein [Candidatus Limnocylindria bacterium]